ncbi:precorrin-4 C(11)-methyltransferase [Desulfothermobacter acidiphilus]|uniref:precorrin-4 C(11)-methyltransferase n=1 Tax=Desulfothermobacter acidiphilus TaxID=1938353 RepID=UPI003F8C6ACA
MRPVYIVGAGPGDPELITVKGARLLREADLVVYAGSLIPPGLLRYLSPRARCYNSAELDLDEIVRLLEEGARSDRTVVRLSSGDPSLYGALAELIAELERRGVPCEVVPGVSSFLAAAARLKKEYTLPGVTQTLILTRVAGRTPVKEDLSALAKHRASLCLFLSASLLEKASAALMEGYPSETPVALLEKVTWPEERVLLGRLKDLALMAKREKITRTALVLVGDFLRGEGSPSCLYHPNFSHTYRKGKS